LRLGIWWCGGAGCHLDRVHARVAAAHSQVVARVVEGDARRRRAALAPRRDAFEVFELTEIPQLDPVRCTGSQVVAIFGERERSD